MKQFWSGNSFNTSCAAYIFRATKCPLYDKVSNCGSCCGLMGFRSCFAKQGDCFEDIRRNQEHEGKDKKILQGL
jgi:hypothetical protein